MQALKQALDFFNNKAPSHHIDLKQQQVYKQEYETFNKKLNKFMVSSSATFAVGVLTGALFYEEKWTSRPLVSRLRRRGSKAIFSSYKSIFPLLFYVLKVKLGSYGTSFFRPRNLV